ncbi:MAG: SDR family oxidoreductase [Betaproteobacteria bacterium]
MNKQFMLKNKTALITGSIAGLGFAMAKELANQGANIILHGLESDEVCQAAKATLIAETGAQVMLSRADLTQVVQIEDMVRGALQTFGCIDIVVNNAVIRNFALVDALPVEQWDESLAVNLSAAFHTARLTIPGMRKQGWGRIINISSVYGLTATANRITYITTKTALIGMTKSIAMDVATTGITCNALCPGTVPTQTILDRIAGIAEREGITVQQAESNYISSRHPTGRFVAMESVAGFVSFLCSEAGKDITGAVLPIDGGWTIE